MFKNMIFLFSFVFVLSIGIIAQATPIPVSVNPAVETVIGEDGNLFPNQSYSTFLLQVSDHIDGITQGRRVTLISFDISGLKNNDKQTYRKMSLSALGFIPGNVDVYGVVEDQDNISGGLKWNNAPGVNNAQKVGYSVELDMDDLTDKLFSFTAPNRDERKSIGACQELDDFINSDTDGVVTFLLAPSKGSKFVKMWANTYPGGGIILNGEMTLGVDIAWITETVDRDEDGIQDDQVWTDWLVAEGYDLNLQPDRYMTLGDDKDPNDTNDYVGELNLADLVIISRTASSGAYATDAKEVAEWGSVTTPILSLSALHIPSNHLKWMNSTTVNTTLDTYMLTELADHPVLDGVTLEDGLVEIVFTEGFADGYQGNCVVGGTDVGNGTLIGQSFSDETIIAEWPAGVEAYDGAGVVQAGPRLLFCAGTENASLSANLFPQGGWNLTDAGEMMLRNSIEYMLSLPPAGAKIVFVTSVKDNDADGIQDDISWVDWLKARGYNVDARPGNWIDPLDPNEIAELEAADLIIASRGIATDEYDGTEAAKWNAITTPIICTNAWMVRNNDNWFWMNSSSANEDAGSPILMVLDTEHPIFAGVELDSDGLVEILDPAVGSGHTSFLTDILDAGNGTLLAQSLGIYNTAWVVEWPADVEYYDGAGQIAGGKRLLFMAGTQDAPYTDANGNIMPVGILNLNDAGKQMFFNAIEYMLAPEPESPSMEYLIHSYTFEDGTADDSVGGANGTLVGGAEIIDGAMVTTAQDQWMEMPGDVIDVNSLDAVTIEAWYTPTDGANTGWSMLAYFGGSSDVDPNTGAATGVGINGYFITSARGDDMSRAGISTGSAEPWADETNANGPEYDDGILHHMVSTLDANEITLYIDGVLQATTPMDAHNSIADLSNDFALLAKGGYGGDPEWIGAIHEFNIYDKALSEAQVATNYAAGPSALEPEGPYMEGLVAHYAMEGDATDSSGNGLDGTLIGDATFAAGVVGMALDLDGNGDYVDCGNPDGKFDITGEISVSMWANIRSTPTAWAAAVAKGESAWRFGVVNTDRRFHFGITNYGPPTVHGVDGNVVVGADEWHHVVGICDGPNIMVYVDGVLDTSIATEAPIKVNTLNMLIGENPEATGRYWNGLLDEIMVFDRALSADEVAALAGL